MASSAHCDQVTSNNDVDDDLSIGNCKVCGDQSNSVHYGIMTCHGCKCFFGRALKNHNSYKCPDENCIINKETRNRCMYCRWIKCLDVGMSKGGTKLGRRPTQMRYPSIVNQPKIQVTKDVNVMVDYKTPSLFAVSSTSMPTSMSLVTKPVYSSKVYGSREEQSESQTVMTVSPIKRDISNTTINTTQYFFNKGDIDFSPAATSFKWPLAAFKEMKLTQSVPSMPSARKLEIGSYSNPTDFSLCEKVAVQCLESYAKAFTFPCLHGYHSAPILSFDNIIKGHHVCFNQIEEQISGTSIKAAMFERLTAITQSIVRFCKGVPGFRSLSLNDQMILIKSVAFEILSLNAASAIDRSGEIMTFLGDPHYLIPFNLLYMTPFGGLFNEFRLLGAKLKSLAVRPIELSILCALALLSSDLPGLERPDSIHYQKCIMEKALLHQLRQRDPTNHEELYPRLMHLIPLIREINGQHSALIVTVNKDHPNRFPPLHKEVFDIDNEDEDF